jgi:hypothetical protein
MATYGNTAGVTALVPEIGPLSTGSTPSDDQVYGWQLEAYAKINRAIANAGYSLPIDSGAAVYAELGGLENLYVAAYALRARGIDTTSGEGEDRSEVWLADFYRQLKDLAASNLTLLGVSLVATTTPTRRRRIRTLQMRKVDGYSRGRTDETFAVQQGEYTGYTAPAE